MAHGGFDLAPEVYGVRSPRRRTPAAAPTHPGAATVPPAPPLLVRIRKTLPAFGALLVASLLGLAPFDSLPETLAAPADRAPTDTSSSSVHAALPVPVVLAASAESYISQDVLWMARCIYSETKRPEEQELVAWVVRNRVETAYRGKRTYRDVVLDPFQFSAFNRGSSKRRYFVNLQPDSQARGWQRALEIAREVRAAPESERPFSRDTRHFYSERSMPGGRAPDWSRGKRPIQPTRYRVDPRRFRFYSRIATITLG